MPECPHCHQRGISTLGKLLLGPARTIQCQVCNGRVSVPWTSVLYIIPTLGITSLTWFVLKLRHTSLARLFDRPGLLIDPMGRLHTPPPPPPEAHVHRGPTHREPDPRGTIRGDRAPRGREPAGETEPARVSERAGESPHTGHLAAVRKPHARRGVTE